MMVSFIISPNATLTMEATYCGSPLRRRRASVQGGTRDERLASSERLWKWIDAHGKEFAIGRPYLGRDPPHVAPVDGQEYAAHNRGSKHAGSDVKKVKSAGAPSIAKRARAAAASKMRNELRARIEPGRRFRDPYRAPLSTFLPPPGSLLHDNRFANRSALRK
jgi:hypothetical protein